MHLAVAFLESHGFDQPEVALMPDGAFEQSQDCVRRMNDIICSTCNNRLLESEVAFGQGIGLVWNASDGVEDVHVVVCCACHMAGKQFTRMDVCSTGPLYSEQRMNFQMQQAALEQKCLGLSSKLEEERAGRVRLEGQAHAADEAARIATDREYVAQEEAYRLRLELETLRAELECRTESP